MALKVELHEEQVLQAVVLAECDTDYGAAITQDNPKVLVPLANTPLLDYTLAWLERCGLDEVIVYCRASVHTDKIRQHCRRFTARREDCGMKVSVVASEDCCSLGDAMRDLYAKSLLKDDFILMQGDLVATLDLKAIVAKHKEDRMADKSVIMTCVYLNKLGGNEEEEGEGGGERDKEVTATLITSATTNKLLHHRRPGRSSKLSIPTELFQASSDLHIYPASYDPSLAVCSEVVPSLFSDNFDYGSRDSLVRGVIEQEELLGYSIRCQVLEGGYASRASSLRQYRRVSGEVMRREAYPMVCESSLTSHRIRYTYDPFTSTYWEPSAKFTNDRGWDVYRGSGGASVVVVVGAGTEVSPSARLRASVVGDHCTLAHDVTATSAFVMNNVHIKAGCELNRCFLGDNVTLEENVRVSAGCVLGSGVTLGPDITVPPGTLLVAHPPPQDEFGETKVAQEPDPAICGARGRAFVLLPGEGEESDEEEDRDGDEDRDSEEGMEDLMSDEDEQRESDFRREVEESLSNALRESSAAENVVLEINASRHAYNVSMEDVLTTVTQGVIRAGRDKKSSTSAESLWPPIKVALDMFADVLKNYVRKGRDQILVLNAVEKLMTDSPEFLPAAQKILFELNQTYEILDDEVVVHWYKTGGAATPAFTKIKASITRFIEWLEEDSGDDDST